MDSLTFSATFSSPHLHASTCTSVVVPTKANSFSCSSNSMAFLIPSFKSSLGSPKSAFLQNGFSLQSSNSPGFRLNHARPAATQSFTLKDIDGKDVSLGKFKRKTLLIVNVASKCDLTTSDYPELSQLEEKYNNTPGIEAEEKKIPIDEKELVLDGGFVVPQTNSFGHTFRDYDAEGDRQPSVEHFYHINHINQTYDFVKRMREEYGKLNKVEMSIWECCELLNDVVDESDPDLDEPQIEHLLQTAEAIRKDYPNEDWLHLTGLIHDLGKVLLHPSFGELPQWAVVGDTFPVGCAFDESIVHHKYFKESPDYDNSTYNTKFGVYSEGCGLNNVMMSWGHDDYMYLVAKKNKTTLPSVALFIIRYHSFYSLHKSGAYKHLMNREDVENLKWLQVFNKYDLYSKSKVRIDVEKVKPYYVSLIEKYFPAKLKW